MDLTNRVSYVNKFKEIKKFYESKKSYNGWDMDCADMFRDDEWMLIDDEDYAQNTYQDLVDLVDDKAFKPFLDEVISSMKYNVRQIEN